MENNKENQTFKQGENKDVLWTILFGVVAFIAFAVIAHFLG